MTRPHRCCRDDASQRGRLRRRRRRAASRPCGDAHRERLARYAGESGDPDEGRDRSRVAALAPDENHGGLTMTKHPAPTPTDDATAAAAAAPRAIDAIPRDHCVDQPDGYVVATINDDPHIKRGDGTAAQIGDVLSVQPDGTLQAREAGANGAYELAKPSGNWLVYRPIGDR